MKYIMRSVFILILIFFIFPVIYSQFTISGAEPILDKLRMDKRMEGSNSTSYSDIVGDPYIYKDFFPGRIIMKTGKTFQVDLRFDMHSNQINFKEGDQIYTLLNPEKVAAIELDTLRIIFSEYIKKAGDAVPEGSSYFILRLDGYCKLLIKRNVDVQDAELPKLYQEAKPAEFVRMADDYYLIVGDDPAVRLSNKKDLSTILNDHKNEIEKFIDSEKLGIKKIEDIIEIVNFYNSLV